MTDIWKHISAFQFVAHTTFHKAWEAKVYYFGGGGLLSLPPHLPYLTKSLLFQLSSITGRFCCVVTISSLIRLRSQARLLTASLTMAGLPRISPKQWMIQYPDISQYQHYPVSLDLGTLTENWESLIQLEFFDGWFAPHAVLDADTHQIKQHRGKAAWQLKKKVREIKEK